LEHDCPNPHVTPHSPQLFGSDDVFTHAMKPSSAQAVRSSGHTTPVHTPLKQVRPAAHARPHAPQLALSNDVLTQAVPPSPDAHCERPSGQVHRPLEQVCPNAHVTPHAPQLFGSNDVFTQAVVPSNGQDVRPSGQDGLVHLPLEQSCPGAHLTPHAPQLFGSIVVFVQAVVPSNGQDVRSSGQDGGSGGSLLHEPSTVNDDLDCAVLCEPLLEHAASTEYATSAKRLTRAPIANRCARQRERIRTTIMLFSPWKLAKRASCRRRRLGTDERASCHSLHWPLAGEHLQPGLPRNPHRPISWRARLGALESSTPAGAGRRGSGRYALQTSAAGTAAPIGAVSWAGSFCRGAMSCHMT
jgi:hypothetical protein